jgi:hypothetical protein
MNQVGNNQWIVLVILIGAPIAYYWLQVARRKREVIRYKRRRVAVYVACILVSNVYGFRATAVVLL